MLTNKV